MYLPQLNGLERLRIHLMRKAAINEQGERRIFLTRWEEELHNDRLGIETKNSYTDFVLEPPSKRQKMVTHGPWYEPLPRTMRMVSTARDLEYKRLRKERLK